MAWAGDVKHPRSAPQNFDPDAKIVLLCNANPRRRGFQTYAIFELYRNGMTVQEFLDSGGRPVDLKADIARGHVKLNPTRPADPS